MAAKRLSVIRAESRGCPVPPLDDCGGDQMKVVDAENPLDLSAQSGQEPEV